MWANNGQKIFSEAKEDKRDVAMNDIRNPVTINENVKETHVVA